MLYSEGKYDRAAIMRKAWSQFRTINMDLVEPAERLAYFGRCVAWAWKAARAEKAKAQEVAALTVAQKSARISALRRSAECEEQLDRDGSRVTTANAMRSEAAALAAA